MGRGRAGPDGTARGRRLPVDVVLPSVVLAVVVAMAVAPGAFASGDPQSCELSRSLEAPSWEHPFGFSVFGCDYLTDTVYAARTSVTIAVLAVAGTVAVALVLGSLAGDCGGWVDVLVSRATDVWAAMPLCSGHRRAERPAGEGGAVGVGGAGAVRLAAMVRLQQPTLSWGLLLLQAQTRLSHAPHLVLPAVVLLLAVASLVVLGQALQRRAVGRAV